MTQAADVIAEAKKYVGYVEQPVNRTMFGQWYGMDGAPWCAMFVSYCFYMSGLPMPAQSPKGFAYCPTGEQWARNMGLWVPRGSGGYHPGDIVLFDWNGDRVADHTGIIGDSLWADGFQTIEGNTDPAGSSDGGRVMLRSDRTVAESLGVIRPQYLQPAPTPSPGPTPPAFQRYLSLTTPNMTGKDVSALQGQLKKFGSNLVADGDFGPVTSNNVRWWQHAFGLTVDGVVGPLTWQAFFSR